MAHESKVARRSGLSRILGLGLALGVGAVLTAGCVLVPVPGPAVFGPPVYRAPRAVIVAPVAPAYGQGRYHHGWR